MRCYAYVRVSTKEQDEEVQVRAIMEFAKQRGIEVPRFFVDKGESGAKPFMDRPGAQQLIQSIGIDNVNCIVSWSLDRMGRTMLDTLGTVISLEERGVRVITVKEEWLQTLDQNVRRLVLSILSWFAEFERRRIRERQEEAWKQGKQKGRPRKIPPQIVKRYIDRYRNLRYKDIWKIMNVDGYTISYSTFRRYIKEIKKT